MLSNATAYEAWRAVVGYEGLYEVSSLGRVKNVLRQAGRTVGRILKPRLGDRGYFYVGLSRDGLMKSHKVHVLVAAAFLGPRPQGHEINHWDTVKTDNAVLNLEYVTKAEHTRHTIEMGLLPSGERHHMRLRPGLFRGERNGRAILSEAQVREIRALRGVITQRQIAEQFGVSDSLVGAIQTGKAWKHVE